MLCCCISSILSFTIAPSLDSNFKDCRWFMYLDRCHVYMIQRASSCLTCCSRRGISEGPICWLLDCPCYSWLRPHRTCKRRISLAGKVFQCSRLPVAVVPRATMWLPGSKAHPTEVSLDVWIGKNLGKICFTLQLWFLQIMWLQPPSFSMVAPHCIE